MKLTTLLFPLFALFIFSNFDCNNENMQPEPIIELGIISATFNGTEIKSNVATAIIIDILPDEVGGETLNISGLTALTAADEALTIGFIIPRGDVLETGTYNRTGDCAVPTEVCVGIGLVDPTDPDNDLAGGTVDGTAEITLLELDFAVGGIVRGTFSGSYRSDNGVEVKVTDGQFHAQIVL